MNHKDQAEGLAANLAASLEEMLDESCSVHPYITLRRAQLAVDAFYANQQISAVHEFDRG